MKETDNDEWFKSLLLTDIKLLTGYPNFTKEEQVMFDECDYKVDYEEVMKKVTNIFCRESLNIWDYLMQEKYKNVPSYFKGDSEESPYPPRDLAWAINSLQRHLREDEDYYIGWKANIAMAFIDEFMRQRNDSDESSEDIINISNKAADNFLQQLIKA